jgi:hypothetical protein
MNNRQAMLFFMFILYFYLVLHPKDCSDLKNKHSKSGVYRIFPDNINPFKVYCDMVTDGGSWTVGILNEHKKIHVIYTIRLHSVAVIVW